MALLLLLMQVPSNSGKEDVAIYPQKHKFMRDLKGMWKKMKH